MATCVGCGLNSDVNGLLQVELRPGGGISCDNSGDANDGLYLTNPIATVSTTPGSCTLISGNGAPGTPLRVDADISEDACNGIQCRGNGLYSPCPDSIAGAVETGFIGNTLPFVVNATHDILSTCTPTATSDCVPGAGTDQVHICNTLCCPVWGIVSVQAFGGQLTDESTDFAAEVSFDVSVNGGAYGTSPRTIWNIFAAPTFPQVNRKHYLPFAPEINWVALPPGDCVAVSGRVRVQVISGTAVWANVPRFEFHWHFTQNCC